MLAMLSDAVSDVTALFGGGTKPEAAPAPPPAAPAAAMPTGAAPVTPGQATDLFGHLTDLEDPKQASSAAKGLAGLPESKRAEAVGKLDDGQLTEMALNVGAGDRKLLEQTLAQTSDPETKLRLWSAIAMAEASRDMTSVGSKIDYTRMNEEDKANLRRYQAAEQSILEVSAERERWKKAIDKFKGTDKAINGGRIRDLIDRKALERQVEQKRGVNLRNDDGNGAAAYTGWDTAMLKEVDETLSHLPADALSRGNVNEIRLSKVDHGLNEAGELEEKETILGDHDKKTGTIRLFEKGLAFGAGSNVGDTSHLGGSDKKNQISALNLTLTHEVGHAVLDNDDAARQKLEGAAGFQNERAEDLPGEVLDLFQKQGIKEPITVGGRTYRATGGRITSISSDSTYVPEHGSHNDGFDRETTDPVYAAERNKDYGYARTSADEFGAEMYAKAVNAPELVYKDFVSDPQKRVASLNEEQKHLEERLEQAKNRGASPDEIDSLEQDLQGTKGALAGAEATATTRAAEAKALREDVFHLMPADVTAARSRLGNAYTPEQAKLLSEYDTLAAQAMTPEQLERLTAEYQGKIKR